MNAMGAACDEMAKGSRIKIASRPGKILIACKVPSRDGVFKQKVGQASRLSLNLKIKNKTSATPAHFPLISRRNRF
jgi:hypothetical protein